MSGAENPFTPRLDVVALTVTLDGRSLAALTGEEARERDLLMMLAATPVLEPLVLDWADAPGTGLSRGYVADPDRDRDLRTIKAQGTAGFFGSVQPWSHENARPTSSAWTALLGNGFSTTRPSLGFTAIPRDTTL